MIRCYLGLGSNLRSPQRQLKQAIHQLKKLPRSVITHLSRVYYSQPCGVRAQPPYYNMVLEIYTSLPAKRLLYCCQQIENKQQRLRKKRWGARTLDIDLLLYGVVCVDQPNLIVPHPQMIKRDFVLAPLLEISPDIRLPNGEYIASYYKNCETYLSCTNMTVSLGREKLTYSN